MDFSGETFWSARAGQKNLDGFGPLMFCEVWTGSKNFQWEKSSVVLGGAKSEKGARTKIDPDIFPNT